MNIRKEKEKEFFEQHLPVFRILGNDSPLFTIKTAFFQKGKTGRHIQLFESELNKDSDIFIEFCEDKLIKKLAFHSVIYTGQPWRDQNLAFMVNNINYEELQKALEVLKSFVVGEIVYKEN